MRIADLKRGDTVLAYSPATGTMAAREILDVSESWAAEFIEIEFGSGRKLVCTASHSLRTTRGWTVARRIKPGDPLVVVSEAGVLLHAQVVSAKRLRKGVEAIYNLVVAADFVFVAEGVVAHSFTHFRWLRSLVWTIATSARRVCGFTVHGGRSKGAAKNSGIHGISTQMYRP